MAYPTDVGGGADTDVGKLLPDCANVAGGGDFGYFLHLPSAEVQRIFLQNR